MKIKKTILYITSQNLVVYSCRGAEWARGTSLLVPLYCGPAFCLCLSAWPDLCSRFEVQLGPSGSPPWSSGLLAEKHHSGVY